MSYFIRNITPADNLALAKIIRNTLTEYKANKPGTVYFDETTDRLSEVFTENGSCYFIAEDNEGNVLGGAGIYPTKGLPAGMCELVKMYLVPEARGKGLGKLLMQKCIHEAANKGYQKIYLETMPELVDAIPLYKKFGFEFIEGPLGRSGHDGCDLFMTRELNADDQLGITGTTS